MDIAALRIWAMSGLMHCSKQRLVWLLRVVALRSPRPISERRTIARVLRRKDLDRPDHDDCQRNRIDEHNHIFSHLGQQNLRP
jgi:hypothetical protein